MDGRVVSSDVVYNFGSGSSFLGMVTAPGPPTIYRRKNCDKQTVLLRQDLTIGRRDRYANNFNLESESRLVF
jgi:hypothetical protein